MQEKVVSRKKQLTIVVTSDEFKDGEDFVELHAVPRWFKVIEEGPAMYFFNNNSEDIQEQEEEQVSIPIPEGIVERVSTIGTLAENHIQDLIASGVSVDDDTLPLEENIPCTTEPQGNEIFRDTWGHDGICLRRQAGGQNVKATVLHFPRNIIPTPVQLFEHLFPKRFLQDIILKQTNDAMHPSESLITYGELLRFIGVWFQMATTTFENRRDFWSTKAVSRHEGAPWRLNDVISRNRFETILSALTLTSRDPPSYKDRFWEIRELQDEWNKNMEENFCPSWISVLDESMSKWLNEHTCPGFMCVSRKPWPLGNEWHTICCANSGVMFAVELVEGKDRPSQLGNFAFSQKGKTVGLLQRLTKSLWHTSKTVILDSGFCVLQGIVELRKRGVFAAALIKKRRYWPKHIRGDEIIAHFKDKEVGSVDAWPGTLDGVSFHVFCMKEPDYVMSLMSTYGTLLGHGVEKKREYKESGQKRIKRFVYPEIVSDYFMSRDKVDAHNSLRMHPIALEETWKTKRWPLRVFQFLLAITEVNVKLVAEYHFGCNKTSQQEFRKLFAHEMVHNVYLQQEVARSSTRSDQKSPSGGHKLLSVPPYRTFNGTTMVKCKTRYIQLKCSECPARIRTYCSCRLGLMLCMPCYQRHLLDASFDYDS